MYTLLQMILQEKLSKKIRWTVGILMAILIFGLFKVNSIFLKDGVIAFKPILGLAPFDVYNLLLWSLFSILMLVDIFMIRKQFIIFLYSWGLFLFERIFDKHIIKQGIEHLEEMIIRLLSLNQIVVFLITTIGTFFLAFYMTEDPFNYLLTISLVISLYSLNNLYSYKFRRILVKQPVIHIWPIIVFLVVLGLYIFITYFKPEYSNNILDLLSAIVLVETPNIGYKNYDYYKNFYKKEIKEEDKIDLG